MIYRTSPARPVRLLLRIVATASAAAVGVACSGELFDPHTEPVGGGVACSDGLCGSIAVPDDASVGGGFACGDGGLLCGTIAVPEDAGDDASTSLGLVCGGDGGLLCGTIAVPEDAGEEDAATGGGLVGAAPYPPSGG